MPKIIIYTAIFGSYDDLIEPREFLSRKYDLKFICFTDRNFSSEIWDIINISKKKRSNFELNREIKFNPCSYLPEHDVSIYIDGNLEINSMIINIVDEFINSNKELGIQKHDSSKSLHEEISNCFARSKITFKEYLKFKRILNDENFVTNNSIIFRKETKFTRDFGELVMTGLLNISRDQLITPSILKHHNERIYFLPKCTDQFKYYRYIPHKEYREKHFIDKFLIKLNFYFKNFLVKIW